MAAAAHHIGTALGRAGRMNFLTMGCGFEDVVGWGQGRFKPSSLHGNGAQFSANFVSLFQSFRSEKETAFGGKDTSNSRLVVGEARSSPS